MTTVTNVGAKSAIPYTTDFSGDPSCTALTPDGLLDYCSSRLHSLDNNIQQYFTEQQTRNAAVADASKLMSVLQSGTWGSGQLDWSKIQNDPQACGYHADKANEILAVWSSTASPEVKNECAQAFNQVTGLDIASFSGKPVTPADIQASAAAKHINGVDATTREKQIESIKQSQSSMSQSSEMNMLQLQSLVTQRQLAVQLTTQVMQTLHDTTKQVIGNIR